MQKQHIHFIGIGGVGMSALAHILVDKGMDVSGSDMTSSYLLESLVKKGVRVAIGHEKKNVEGATSVVYSSDVAMQNPECQEALQRGLPLIHRSQLLAELINRHTSLVVAGTHGKTTTSSLLAHLLKEAQFNPSYAIGGIVHSLGSNGGGGKGDFFVVEADESDGSFLKYFPWGAILTNSDNDHFEFWKTEAELLKGFKRFGTQVSSKEHLFWCQDSEPLKSLNLEGYSYGFTKKADLFIENFYQLEWKNNFDLKFKGESYKKIEIPLIGSHNVLNAAAVFGMGLQLGIASEQIYAAFKTFSGIGRRAEKKGNLRGIPIYDDYAHHPTEIATTLRALKTAVGTKRLVAVFQPHRYSRVRDCLEQFPPVFDAADVLIITDIFSAREDPIPGITTAVLTAKIQERKKDVFYIPRKELTQFCFEFLQPQDVLVTMGAGDITKVGSELLNVG